MICGHCYLNLKQSSLDALDEETFSQESKHRKAARADDPFRILEKNDGTTYTLELPGDYGIQTLFNVPKAYSLRPKALRSYSIKAGETGVTNQTIPCWCPPDSRDYFDPRTLDAVVQMVAMAIGMAQIVIALFSYPIYSLFACLFCFYDYFALNFD